MALALTLTLTLTLALWLQPPRHMVAGALPQLLALSASSSTAVKLQSVWALANLAVDPAVKQTLQTLRAVPTLNNPKPYPNPNPNPTLTLTLTLPYPYPYPCPYP